VPELPEVETVRRGLAERVVGRRITAVEVGRERTVRRTSREALVAGLTDTTMLSAGRRGKYLVCPLDSGDALMIHLRMSGQLLLAAHGAPRPPHTHVVAHLNGPAPEELWFVDPRTFGEVVVFDPTRIDIELPELARMGVDPIADGLDRARLRTLLLTRRRQLKPLLLDQHVIAGLGNIYVDEILHRSRLHPLRTSDTLSGQEITRLHRSIHDVLVAAIGSGGSTLGDRQYVDLMGSGGAYQDDHRVYDRAGQRCASCGTGVVVRIPFGGRSTHFCPRCQPIRRGDPGLVRRVR
jgi:formamidopyrimidine-DNA glycosylase